MKELEELEVKSFLDLDTSEMEIMSEDVTKVMFVALTSNAGNFSLKQVMDPSFEKTPSEEFPINLENLRQDFSARLLNSRLPEGLDISCDLAIFLLYICKTPGEVVMWAWTLHNFSLKKDISHISLGDLCDEFPVGFPKEEAKRKIWEDQKGRNHGIEVDNLLDWGPLWVKDQ